MQAIRIETEIQHNGKLTLHDLPLRAGEEVEVIILVRSPRSESVSYPLRGLPVRYERPTDPVAEQDWEAS